MAARSYEAGLKKYYGDRFTHLSDGTTNEEIKYIYDNWASEYEKDVVHAARGIYHKPLAECLDEAIKQVFQDKPKDELKIIDVGAGTGLIGVELHKLGYTDLHALDISQEMLNEAKKKNVYKRYICAALSDQRIPEVETEEFHALICGGTLITAHIRPSALEEMVRMVKIGGLICFNIRDGHLVNYQENIWELERRARWELVSRKTVSFFESEEMPRETFVFSFKVL